MDTSSKSMTECLKLWDQAGESPHEALKEEGLYELFESLLQQNVVEEVKLYRGINVEKGRRFESVAIGGILSYDCATSWSLDPQIAERCVCWNPTILVWDVKKESGIFNHQNTYGEQEVIMTKRDFKVKGIDSKFVFVE